MNPVCRMCGGFMRDCLSRINKPDARADRPRRHNATLKQGIFQSKSALNPR